jgi:cell division protein FtsI/penicillin-binding protein 2
MLTVLLIGVCVSSGAPRRTALEDVIRSAFADQHSAGAAVVVRVHDRHVLAAYNVPVLTRRLATPGSAIKPFVLAFMLENHILRPDERIACRRKLTINGTRLDCSHPEAPPFDAEEALAFSCNSYFVEAAARLRPGELERRFIDLGFTRPSRLLPHEADGHVSQTHSLAERQLLAIGAAGVEITPLELASAYVDLALQAQHATPAASVVLSGLRDATTSGLAHAAFSESITTAGKTGTASDPGQARTHAWFAGFAPAQDPQMVVVVFVERGRGSVEASTIAGQIFDAYVEQR